MNTVRGYLNQLKAAQGDECFVRMVLANDNPMVIKLLEVHEDYIVGKDRYSSRPEIFPISSIVHFRDVTTSKEHTW